MTEKSTQDSQRVSHEKLIRSLSCWDNDDNIFIEPLGGGITNHNYHVTTVPDRPQAGRNVAQSAIQNANDTNSFAVRIGSDIPVHHIFRTNEIAAAQAADSAGLSPSIRHAQDGVLVMDYIDATTLTPELVRSPGMLERIVPLVQRCHSDIGRYLKGPTIGFWVFQVVRDYAWSLRDANSPHIKSLDELLKAADELEQRASPFDIIFGHNDLLAANLLDDGNRLWLIDWEYAGFNTPLFDLGGIASNNEFTPEQEVNLLELYFDHKISDHLWHRYQAMKTASLLRETMWSMISECHSTLDFDYSAYTDENMARFAKSLDDFRAL